MTINDGSVFTAPHLISYLIQDDGLYIPLNNGDFEKIESLIGSKIHIMVSYADHSVYRRSNTFLSILNEAFEYHGPVEPPAPK